MACNHADTFLHIPLSVRQRIYLYAGVPTGTYMAYPIIGPVDGDGGCTVPDEDYTVTLNLLFVCRQIEEEVEAVLLDRNTLVYSEDNIDEGLTFLGGLSPYLCSMLTNVYVHLYVGPDHPEEWRPHPFSLSSERIDSWQTAAYNMLYHATPHRLRLHIICDTGASKKTAAVLEPLRCNTGALLELELRLHVHGLDYKGHKSQERDELLSYARDIALQAQGPDANAPSGPFRFLDLPVEIQRNIFEYTNLVAPYRKVHWNPESGFEARFIFCECDGSVCLEEDLHAGHEFDKCGANMNSCITGDFCMRYHTSYSTRCNHSLSPLPLLLVCRAMYEEAIDFFYASNRIVVTPHWNPGSTVFARTYAGAEASAHDPDGPNTGVQAGIQAPFDPQTAEIPGRKHISFDATKIFLESLGSKSLRLLRNLEIVFPRIGVNSSLLDTDPALHRWCMAVDYLACLTTKVDAPRLNLVVHIWTAPAGYYGWEYGKTAHILEAQTTRLLKPLRALSQLERLFVHLEWQHHWSPPKLLHDIKTCKIPRNSSPGCDIGEHHIPGSQKAIADMEVRFEKMVMGDEYDSSSLGKGEELPSPWVRSGWGQIL